MSILALLPVIITIISLVCFYRLASRWYKAHNLREKKGLANIPRRRLHLFTGATLALILFLPSLCYIHIILPNFQEYWILYIGTAVADILFCWIAQDLSKEGDRFIASMEAKQ